MQSSELLAGGHDVGEGEEEEARRLGGISEKKRDLCKAATVRSLGNSE